MPGVISAHPGKELTGSPTCELWSFYITPMLSTLFKFLLLTLALRHFLEIFLPIQPLLDLRMPCFDSEKSIAITGGREKRGNMLKREGDRLLSLSVWPCLTAVISLNCFANIIPTQPGSRSARPLCWSWLEAVLLHDLSLSLPFLSCFPFRPISIRIKM